mmetsp:Transcript_142148/g.442070  ORF Transcript_142148/g.442070 Transcript_142148/m.442070 type:complete len:218 (-) Transcript_142148:64-717(-)
MALLGKIPEEALHVKTCGAVEPERQAPSTLPAPLRLHDAVQRLVEALNLRSADVQRPHTPAVPQVVALPLVVEGPSVSAAGEVDDGVAEVPVPLGREGQEEEVDHAHQPPLLHQLLLRVSRRDVPHEDGRLAGVEGERRRPDVAARAGGRVVLLAVLLAARARHGAEARQRHGRGRRRARAPANGWDELVRMAGPLPDARAFERQSLAKHLPRHDER